FDVTVTARDAFNNLAAGYLGTVHFTGSDGSAVLPSNYTFVGGDSGAHTFTAATTLKQAGAQNVTATDTVTGSITGTQNGISVAPGAADKLSLRTQPAGATAGSAFSTQPVVAVEDAFGNTVTSDTSSVVVSLGSGSGSLQGTLTKAAVNGVATFTNLRIDASGAKTLHFTDGSLTAADSSSFTVAPDAANKLALTTQPGGATAGSAFATQPVVTVQDQFGNTVTGDGSTVTVALLSGSGSLQGTLTKAAVNGVAAFTNLRLDNAADAKILRFTDGSLTTANSGSVTVASDVASKLAVTTQPAGATAGANLTTQPVVTVQDQFGNTVTGDGSTV